MTRMGKQFLYRTKKITSHKRKNGKSSFTSIKSICLSKGIIKKINMSPAGFDKVIDLLKSSYQNIYTFLTPTNNNKNTNTSILKDWAKHTVNKHFTKKRMCKYPRAYDNVLNISSHRADANSNHNEEHFKVPRAISMNTNKPLTTPNVGEHRGHLEFLPPAEGSVKWLHTWGNCSVVLYRVRHITTP